MILPRGTPEELDRILAQAPSPFSDSVLTHAFRDPPDAPAIHAAVRQHLEQLVHDVGDAGESVIQVVMGDPGDGKTHLLSWLRKHSEVSLHTPSGRPFVVAPIEPVRSKDRIFHHVLHETIRHLSRPFPLAGQLDSAVGSPLAYVVLRALLRVARLLRIASFTAPALVDELDTIIPSNSNLFLGAFAEVAATRWSKIERDFVSSAMQLDAFGGMDRELFQVVAGFPHPENRQDLLAWLGGAALSPEVMTRLGARFSLDGESEAWRGLQLLIHLAGLAQTPLVLAFDQIEGTERLGDEAVSAWLSALGEIYNAGGATVLLVLCQTQIWPRLCDHTQQQVRDRLEALPPMKMRALRTEEAVALVDLRMQRFWRGLGFAPQPSSYPFELDELDHVIRQHHLRTPRSVLRHMRQLLDEKSGVPQASTQQSASRPPPPSEVRQRLNAILEEERRRPPRMPEIREQIVQGAVREAFLAALAGGRRIDGAKVDEVDQPPTRARAKGGTRVTLTRGGIRRRLYFETNNSVHGQSVAAAIKRLRDILRDGQADRAMLLRETAQPLPPTSRDLIARLAPRGTLLWLDPDSIAPLAAFEQLLNAAAAGDVPVREDDVRRAAFDIDAVDQVVTRAVDGTFQDGTPSARPDHPWKTDVMTYLRNHRAIVPLPRLVQALEAPAEAIHEATESLVADGAILIQPDRQRVPVVFLRPVGGAAT